MKTLANERERGNGGEERRGKQSRKNERNNTHIRIYLPKERICHPL
jgi:hypothetical protein